MSDDENPHALDELFLRRRAEQVRRVILRSCGKLWFPEVFLHEMKPGQAIHANRQTGKTEALFYAVRHWRAGRAVIVAPTANAAHQLRNRYWSGHWDEADETVDLSMPVFLSARAAVINRNGFGMPRQFFCDEWFCLQ